MGGLKIDPHDLSVRPPGSETNEFNSVLDVL